MVADPVLRHHASPVCYVCIISESKDARGRKLGREEGLGPWLGRVAGGPGPLAIASQAVDEDDAGQGLSGPVFLQLGMEVYVLDGGMRRTVKQFDA